MPILDSSNSAANKDMMSKIWTNGDTVIWLTRKHCGKRRNCLLWAISPFRTIFIKVVWCCVRMSICGVKAYMPYVPDCLWQSQILVLCPGVPEIMKLSWKFKKIKSTDFLRPIECEGFVINSCLNDKCCMCCHVPIISGIPVVIDRH